MFTTRNSTYTESQLRRIVSMLTRLLQRTDRQPDAAFEYEYEYRDAEYE